MTVIRFIGDVHGKFTPYKKLIKDVPVSIQVGDLGLGFRHTSGYREGEFTQNPPHYAMAQGNHRFIRGNHDNPHECKKHSQWIVDGTIEDGVMFIGGAESIDKEWRRPEYSWWEEEQLSDKQLDEITQKFLEQKPHTVISHDCPSETASILCEFRYKPLSRTQQALQAMWNGHSPETWIFGHWHQSWMKVLEKGKKNTTFVCLNELEHLDLEI